MYAALTYASVYKRENWCGTTAKTSAVPFQGIWAGLQLKASDLLGSSVGVGYSVTLSGFHFIFASFQSVSIGNSGP